VNSSTQSSPAELPMTAAEDGVAPIDADYGASIRIGIWTLVAGLGGFLLWALFAPLDEGVPATGVVSVESKRKRIDHLGGGVIEAINVREGQRVKAGDPLITFNEVQAKASLDATLSQWRVAAAAESRLNAERSGAASITFPPALLDARGQPEVASSMRTQSELFRSRRDALQGELRIIRESVRGLEMQILSLDQLKAGRDKQIEIFKEQLDSYRRLRDQGFVSRNQLLDVERLLAEVQSKQGEDMANIAAASARLAEFRLRENQRQTEFRRDVESEQTQVQRDVATLSERLTALRDTHARLIVHAPVSGTVVDLAFHTEGGTVRPAERILDIVPDGDQLIVEAQVATQYIDRVHADLTADVRFDAYMADSMAPEITGKVVLVSADTLNDPRTGAPYYAVRVSVPPEELKKLGKLSLQPGMQGTVVIKTGERSLMSYLLRPLTRRFHGAMGER